MKKKIKSTASYVKKHNLSKNDKFNHRIMASDLKKDFNTLIFNDIKTHGKINIPRFEEVVKNITSKFNSINNKTNGILPSSFWKFFCKSIIEDKRSLFFSNAS